MPVWYYDTPQGPLIVIGSSPDPNPHRYDPPPRREPTEAERARQEDYRGRGGYSRCCKFEDVRVSDDDALEDSWDDEM